MVLPRKSPQLSILTKQFTNLDELFSNFTTLIEHINELSTHAFTYLIKPRCKYISSKKWISQITFVICYEVEMTVFILAYLL